MIATGRSALRRLDAASRTTRSRSATLINGASTCLQLRVPAAWQELPTYTGQLQSGAAAMVEDRGHPRRGAGDPRARTSPRVAAAGSKGNLEIDKVGVSRTAAKPVLHGIEDRK